MEEKIIDKAWNELSEDSRSAHIRKNIRTYGVIFNC